MDPHNRTQNQDHVFRPEAGNSISPVLDQVHPGVDLAHAGQAQRPTSSRNRATSWASGGDEVEIQNDHDINSSPYSTHPLPSLPESISPRGLGHPDPRAIPLSAHRVSMNLPNGERESDFNTIQPYPSHPRSFGERLQPTLLTAIAEKEKYAFKAKLTGFILNAAIGVQVFLGSLTTVLSVSTEGHHTQIMTAVLGGAATIVASYLARARGSNEPELSIARVKDLEQFIRECEAFNMDYGHLRHDPDLKLNEALDEFRRRFEDLLGNGNGERRLSPPV